MRKVLIFAIFGALLVSCKPKEIVTEVPVEVPHYIHDTLKVTIKEKETVHVTDSMWISGDTIYKWRDRWREYVVHDTIVSIKNDTIGIPVEITKTEIKEVKKPLTWMQKTLMGAGGFFLVCGFMVIAFFFIKSKFKI